MSIEENLIKHSSPDEKNQELRRELDAALLLIKNYESIIQDLKTENANNLRKFAHDLANPLQILSMTVESLEEKVPAEFTPGLNRMKRSADIMMEILQSIRKMKATNSPSTKEIKVV